MVSAVAAAWAVAWRRVAREFTHFFALILWVAAALAFFAESRSPGEGMWQLGVAVVAVILINGAFSYWQEYRAEKAIDALRKLLPQVVKVMRDGQLTTVPGEQLVPGDVILLEAGDNVPADCRLVAGNNVRVNASTITGESLPKARTAEQGGEGNLLDTRNVLLAGTSLVSGDARALVFATGMHTELGRTTRQVGHSRRLAQSLGGSAASVDAGAAKVAGFHQCDIAAAIHELGRQKWPCLSSTDNDSVEVHHDLTNAAAFMQ